MAGKDNLKPIRTSERARELGSKGGKASAAKRRKRRALRECMEILLAMPPSDDGQAVLDTLGIAEAEQTGAMVLAASLYREAARGNVTAFKELRSLLDEDARHEIDSEVQIIFAQEDFATDKSEPASRGDAVHEKAKFEQI